MHDPSTVAFTIPYPWNLLRSKRGSGLSDRRYFTPFITIWHQDPCRTKGRAVRSDDSCGWFMRSGHGDPAVLDKIVKRFEENWDNVYIPDRADHDEAEDGPYKPNVYYRGYFTPDGDPRMSAHGIVLNLFFVATNIIFKSDGLTNWKRSQKFMRRHLFDILMFAENPTDSLFDSIVRTFEIEHHTAELRAKRIRSLAGAIYGWILRKQRPWYKHPRWHIWHWRLQVHPLQTFKRWAFSRCCKCGKGFAWGYCPTTDSWNGTGPLWFRSERGTYHSNCGDPTNNNAQTTQATQGER